MAENLKFLPSVSPVTAGGLESPHYYVYDYNGVDVSEAKSTQNFQTYGVLYNWNAAMAGATSSSSNPSGVQGVCPTGWHLPSHSEWIALRDYLGVDAGGKLKERGTAHWYSPNEGATNESGFTALGGGLRNSYSSTFQAIKLEGTFQSATEYINPAYIYMISLNCYYDKVGITEESTKDSAFSVRCIKD